MNDILIVSDIEGPAYYHVGDEAIFTANLQWLQQAFSRSRILATSSDPSYSATIHGIPVLPEAAVPVLGIKRAVWKWILERDILPASRVNLSAMRRVLSELKNTKLLLILGGGNLSSLFPGPFQLRSFLIEKAVDWGIPVILTGQTLGPFNRRDRKRISSWLGKVTYLGLRDSLLSKEIAQSAGAADERTAYVIDDAYCLPTTKPSDSDTLRKLATIPKPLVGLSLHRLDPSDDFAHYARVLDDLASRHGFHYAVIPHLRSSYVEDDVHFARQIIERMRDPKRVTVFDEFFSDKEAKYLTSQCDFVIASRYHAAVFALSTNVPCIGLFKGTYTEVKLLGLFQALNLEPAVVKYDRSDLSQIISTHWKSRPAMTDQLRAKNTVAFQAVSQEKEKLRKLISTFLLD